MDVTIGIVVILIFFALAAWNVLAPIRPLLPRPEEYKYDEVNMEVVEEKHEMWGEARLGPYVNSEARKRREEREEERQRLEEMNMTIHQREV